MKTIRVFKYIEELDAFVITPEFRALSDTLGLNEWHPAVWIGRLFALDNDFGEHWFDNWDEREAREAAATLLGLDTADLMIVVPARFKDGADGPCHSDSQRKHFWTNVLNSLELDYDLIFEEAHLFNAQTERLGIDKPFLDLENRIETVRANLRKQADGTE